jgi:demethylmenaquinone methyltransferase/2-methoxy-6-polyprenyl-1,4-benzoquinol methylase
MQDPGYVRSAFARIARRYVLANHVLSLGIDTLWRRVVAGEVRAGAPARVLDLATGSGDLMEAVRKACPETKVIGADFCLPMLGEAKKRGLPGLVAADGMRLPFADGVFDALTVGFGLRNMASWPDAVAEMARVIRPGGRLVVLDFSLPRGLLNRPYRFYLHKILPRLAGWLTGERDAYEYLGGSIERFPSGPAMEALLTGHGFSAARTRPLSGGIASVYVAEK